MNNLSIIKFKVEMVYLYFLIYECFWVNFEKKYKIELRFDRMIINFIIFIFFKEKIYRKFEGKFFLNFGK